MISLHPCPDVSLLQDLKRQHLQRLTAPMDGMWEVGFIAAAPHGALRVDGTQAGYYAANEEGTLLQFYVRPAFEAQAPALFAHVLAQEALTHAQVSTIDPAYLSLSLDVQKQVQVHTYLYEHHTTPPPRPPTAEALPFRLVTAAELDRTIAFQQACLAGEGDLSDWLRGYSANLIQRGELFVLHRDEAWLGLGECRVSDTQQGIADLGMMVWPAHRGQGWATHILTRLVAYATAHDLTPICSTTVANPGAQKAILRAGFISRHRILKVTF